VKQRIQSFFPEEDIGEFCNSNLKKFFVSKINNSLDILGDIQNDKTMQEIWKTYTKKFDYASGIPFVDTIAALKKLFDMYYSQ
jgi:hypothetical protein